MTMTSILTVATHVLRLAVITAIAAPAAGWTQVPIADPPKGRWTHGITYDTTAERLLMFGGECECQTKRNDLFAFRNGEWTTIYTDGNTLGPSQRMNIQNAFVHSPNLGQTLLFGGRSENGLLDDTWLLQGNLWQNIPPGAVNPSARDAHAIAPYHDLFVMWGGTTKDNSVALFSPSAGSWETRTYTITPALRAFHGMVYDTQRNVVVMFGGRTLTGTVDEALNDTWEYSLAGWRRIPVTGAPQPRWGFAMTFDPVSRSVLVFGGQDESNALFDDTWAFDGVAWRLVDTPGSTRPSSRVGAAMAFDPFRNATMLFGGNAILTQALPFSDTWQLPGFESRRSVFLPAALHEFPAPLVEAEDNDNALQANILPLYRELRGRTDDDYDVFRVTAGTTGTLNISLSDLPAAANGRVQLQLLQASQQLGFDAAAPYALSVPATPGDYLLIVFTDKANYPQDSPYRVLVTQ